MAELQKMRRKVCALKHKIVHKFLPVSTSRLFILNFLLLDRLIEKSLRFESLLAFDA